MHTNRTTLTSWVIGSLCVYVLGPINSSLIEDLELLVTQMLTFLTDSPIPSSRLFPDWDDILSGKEPSGGEEKRKEEGSNTKKAPPPKPEPPKVQTNSASSSSSPAASKKQNLAKK